MPNYNYVIDSSFNPFSMEEMLTPFASYKEAYDKAEDTFVNLMNNADTFSYLAKVAEENPNSKAAQIYKAYADEMNKQFDDFSKHGLNSSNNRGLLNLKRRYNGEIGMLEAAKTALDKENELRRNSKDSSMDIIEKLSIFLSKSISVLEGFLKSGLPISLAFCPCIAGTNIPS